MWWKRLKSFVANELFPELNRFANVVYKTPTISVLDGNKLELRVKQRGDGFAMISLLIHYPDPDTPHSHSIDFGPEEAELIKSSLDSCLAAYSRTDRQSTA